MRRLALALVQRDGDTVSIKVASIPFVASSSRWQVLACCRLLLGACRADHFIFNQFSAVLEAVVFFEGCSRV